MTEKELLAGVLSKTVNLDEEGVTALYNADGSIKDDALATILKLDSERVKGFKAEAKQLGQDQYSRGKRESMEELEKSLRDEHGIKSEKTGKDLINEIVDGARKSSKTAKTEHTDDDVKKHPLYLKMEEEAAKSIKELEASWKQKLEDATTGFNRERTLVTVKGDAKAIFDEMKPILSEDPVRARNQFKLFESAIDGHEYQVEEKDGKRSILVMKDGKRLENDHGTVVPFDQFVRSIVQSNYDLPTSEKRTSGGSPNDASKETGTKVKPAGTPPKTFDEYSQRFQNIELTVSDIKERNTQLVALRAQAKEAGLAV